MTDHVAAAFDETPVGYGTRGDFHERYAEALVTAARLQPGETVLDVATGTAPAAIAAARAVGPDGHVTGVDISPGMLEQARHNLAEAGFHSSRLVEAHGARLPFDRGTFDVVICASSLVWFPDIQMALREWRRVLRPGGRVAFSTPAASALPLGKLYRAHLRGYGVAFPDITEPLDTPEKCRRALLDAGFRKAQVHAWPWHDRLASVDDAVAAGTIALLADPDGTRRWDAARREPVALWAKLRRGIPIAVPLTAAQLDQLDADYRSEVEHLVAVDGFIQQVTSLLAVAYRA